MTTPLLNELVKALTLLPGIGPKSAQRIAFYLLERNRDGARRLARALDDAMARIGQCEACRTFSETPRCGLCAASTRDASLLCVVETPTDVVSIEQAASYKGLYYVLLGRLSPIDGITPDTLGMPLLERRLQAGEVKEMIIATGTTMEGEATAHYLSQLGKRAGVKVSRIAFGVPMGGELEYVDGTTLSLAIASRRDY